MAVFNTDSRTKNAAKASIIGLICSFVMIIMGFYYRAEFLEILTVDYQGINSLFGNILSFLSLTELGVGSVIVYRFYLPIQQGDVKKVGQLMNFMKSVYRVIAIVILLLGLMILPFLDFFIKDTSKVPADVNLRFVYILFLIQTLSTYVFSYKITILSADQRQYIVTLVNSIKEISKYIISLFILHKFRNYTYTLFFGIAYSLLTNYLLSLWTSFKYKEVFKIKDKLSKEDKRKIFTDTKATMCHKVGGVTLGATDSIVMSKFQGIDANGLYGNYKDIFEYVKKLMGQLFSTYVASIGNAHVSKTSDEKYDSFKKLMFANLWIDSVCVVCIYNLVDDFIFCWLGNKMLLEPLIVIAFCIEFFVHCARFVSSAFVSGSGLFVKDVIRPFIEAILNIVFSIILVIKIGYSGVVFGTVISHVATVVWREPYLVFKYELKRSSKGYWTYYSLFAALTVGLCVGISRIKALVTFGSMNFGVWIIEALIIFVITNFVLFLIFIKNGNMWFFIKTLGRLFAAIKRKILRK